MPDGYRMGTSFKSDLLGRARMEMANTVENFPVHAQAIVVKDSQPSP
jgi:hypothetical protein